jgi:hypothetical protein
MLQPKYRIALLVDTLEVPVWVRDLADWAIADPAIELSAVIVGPPPDADALEWLLTLEKRFLCGTREYRSYTAVHSIAGCAPAFAADEVDGLQLDAIVRCGRAKPTAAMLEASSDGILSIAADTFGEILEGRPDTPFTVQRLVKGGKVEALFSGSVATALLYSWNFISLQARAFSYVRRTLEQLAAGEVRALGVTGAGERKIGPADLLAYGVKSAHRSVGKALRRLFRKEFNWQVAFARQPWSGCNFGQATVVPNPPNAFLADPFTISVDKVTYLFVEEFPFDTRKGVISAYRLAGEHAERIGVVLEEAWHLSFPFVFEHKGEIYMVPEGGGGRSVKLYKASSFPTAWTEVKTLLADVPAVDTIVFEHDSRWWMLTSIQGDGPALNNAELHAFYADDLLGDWTPHAQNPIVMDAGKGRNGGFVRDRDGHPYRISQTPGFTFYGAGSAVHRIDELTPGTYRETLVEEVRPTFFPNLDGTHHIHDVGGLTFFDFMRVERPGKRMGWLSRITWPRMHSSSRFEPRLTVSAAVFLRR